MKTKKFNIERPSLLELEITRIVDKAIKDSKIDLTAEDIKIIVHEIMPDLDRMISKKIQLHFLAIGQFLIEKFNMGD